MSVLSFRKNERLTGEIRVSNLFAEGEAFICFPFRVVFQKREKKEGHPLAKILIAVPKKRFKRAIKRNLLKRRMREAYRKNKELLYSCLSDKDFTIDFSLSYVANEELEYARIEKKMIETLEKLIEKLR